jgi:hypothetical protein
MTRSRCESKATFRPLLGNDLVAEVVPHFDLSQQVDISALSTWLFRQDPCDRLQAAVVLQGTP